MSIDNDTAATRDTVRYAMHRFLMGDGQSDVQRRLATAHPASSVVEMVDLASTVLRHFDQVWVLPEAEIRNNLARVIVIQAESCLILFEDLDNIVVSK